MIDDQLNHDSHFRLNIGSNASLMAINERQALAPSKSNLQNYGEHSSLEATRLPPIKTAERNSIDENAKEIENELTESPSRNVQSLRSKKKS